MYRNPILAFGVKCRVSASSYMFSNLRSVTAPATGLRREFNRLFLPSGPQSRTDIAAFIMHEAIYKTARRFAHASTSMGSRQAVAALFAKNISAEDRNDVITLNIFSIPSGANHLPQRPNLRGIFASSPDQKFIVRFTVRPGFSLDEFDAWGEATDYEEVDRGMVSATSITPDPHRVLLARIQSPTVGENSVEVVIPGNVDSIVLFAPTKDLSTNPPTQMGTVPDATVSDETGHILGTVGYGFGWDEFHEYGGVLSIDRAFLIPKIPSP